MSLWLVLCHIRHQEVHGYPADYKHTNQTRKMLSEITMMLHENRCLKVKCQQIVCLQHAIRGMLYQGPHTQEHNIQRVVKISELSSQLLDLAEPACFLLNCYFCFLVGQTNHNLAKHIAQSQPHLSELV